MGLGLGFGMRLGLALGLGAQPQPQPRPYAGGEDPHQVWIDLKLPDEDGPPIGQACVSLQALSTLRAVYKEASDEPEKPPPSPLPDESVRWRLRVQLTGVVLQPHPEHPSWYAVHLLANGERLESR